MAQPPLREHYDSDREYFIELDIYNTRIATDVANAASAVSSAATAGMDDQGRVVIDGTPVGYPLRYLDTAYASDAVGTNFAANPQGLPNGTTPVFQGVRNTASTVQSTTPGDFIWREVNSTIPSQDLNAFKRTIGGRNIDWMFSSAAEIAGFIIDSGASVIDLDSLPGAVGDDGNTSGTKLIFFRTTAATVNTPTGGTFNSDTGQFLNLPTNWTETPTTGTTTLWVSVANLFGTGVIDLTWSAPAILAGSLTVVDTANGASIVDVTGTSVEIVDGVNPTVTAITGGIRVTDADGDTVDILDGNDGLDGDGVEIIYQTASTAPATPVATTDAPAGWSFTLPDSIPAGEFLWISIGTRVNNTGAYTWTPVIQFTPSIISVAETATGATITETTPDGTTTVNITDGVNPTVTAIAGGVRITDGDGDSVDVLDGNNGMDGDGVELIYRTVATTPATPDPSEQAPTGWSFTLPSAVPDDQFLWVSIGTRANNTGNYTWTPPVQFSPTLISVAETANGSIITRTEADGSSTSVTITNGTNGLPGAPGRSITSVSKLGDTVTVTYSTGDPDTFVVADGTDGSSVTVTSVTTQPDGSIRVLFSDDSFVDIPQGAAGRGIESVLKSGSTVTVTYDDGSAADMFTVNDGVSAIEANVTSTNGFVFSLGLDGIWDPAVFVNVTESTGNIFTDVGLLVDNLGASTVASGRVALIDPDNTRNANGITVGFVGGTISSATDTNGNAYQLGATFQLLLSDENSVGTSLTNDIAALDIGDEIWILDTDTAGITPQNAAIGDRKVFRLDTLPTSRDDGFMIMTVTWVDGNSGIFFPVGGYTVAFATTGTAATVTRTISTLQEAEFLRSGTGEVLGRINRTLSYNIDTEAMTIGTIDNPPNPDVNADRVIVDSALSSNRGEVRYTYQHNSERRVAQANVLIQQRGLQGIPGVTPPATALVNIFTRSEAQPTTFPDLILNYTVDTAAREFQGGATVSNGWYINVADVPDGAGEIWQRSGTVVTATGTGAILTSAWSGAIQTGSTGADGQDGLNAFTIEYFQRTDDPDNPPGLPQNQAMYTFSTDTLTPTTNSSWTTALPPTANGRYLWRTVATAASRTDMDIIESSEWGPARIYVFDGVDGMDGDPGRSITSVTKSGQTVTVNFDSGDPDTFTVADGQNGTSVTVRTVETLDNGDIRLTFTDDTQTTIPAGAAGRGINSVTKSGTTVTITFDDGSPAATFEVADGFSPTVVAITGGVRITDADGDTVDILDGNDGQDGDGLEIIYQNATSRPSTPSPSASAPSGWSFTQTSPGSGERTYISIGTRTNNMGNYTWTIAAPITAVDGTDGAAGSRFAEVTVYTDPAVTTAPSAPSATFRWSDGQLLNLTNGWSRVPPTQLVTDQQLVFSSRFVFVDSTGEASTTDDTGDQPAQATNFSGLVTFTGTDFAVDGATITSVDGGFIRTGTLSAEAIDLDGPITFDDPRSSLLAGRTSTSDFGTDGFYIGRTSFGGTVADGFQLSHTSVTSNNTLGDSGNLLSNGTVQAVIHDDVGGLRLYEPVFYQRGNVNPGNDTIITENSGNNISLAAGEIHTITLQGGGGCLLYTSPSPRDS